jgi:hypothetical protein
MIYGKPKGEICLRYDDPEIVTEPEQVTLDEQRELFINQLDGWIKKINLAIGKIEPYICQEKVVANSKHGPRVIIPCLTPLYKVLVEMSETLYSLRKEMNR